jgi:hypothetical protein
MAWKKRLSTELSQIIMITLSGSKLSKKGSRQRIGGMVPWLPEITRIVCKCMIGSFIIVLTGDIS